MTVELAAAIAAITERPPRLALSIEEAAQSIGVSKSVVEELIATGQLRTKHIGRRVVIPVSALKRFVGDV